MSDLINIKGLCIDFKEISQSVLYVHNREAIDMIKSFENSEKTKHIAIRYNFVKDLDPVASLGSCSSTDFSPRYFAARFR